MRPQGAFEHGSDRWRPAGLPGRASTCQSSNHLLSRSDGNRLKKGCSGRWPRAGLRPGDASGVRSASQGTWPDTGDRHPQRNTRSGVQTASWLRGPGSASYPRKGHGGRPAPSQGLLRAARALPGLGAGVGPTGEPADPGRSRPRLPEWQLQRERLRRATPLRPSPRPRPSRAERGDPSVLAGCFWEATMAGTIDWLYQRKG